MKWLKSSDTWVKKFFIKEYSDSQRMNPSIYKLNLRERINKEDMIEYFLETLFVLEIAHKNVEKTKHLHEKSNVSSVAQTKLGNRINKYKKAVEYLQRQKQ